MLFTKGNKNTTKHYYPATLLKLYLSLSLLFYGSSSVQMLLIPSYTNVAQHTHSCILTAHLLIDFWMVFELKTSIRQGCLSGSLIRVYKSRNLVGVEFRNLRSGPILAVLIHSPWRLPLKSGLIQTLTSLYSLRPDFGHNADWLLEQRHRIWLAVEINRSWKSSFLAWLFLRMISHGQREGSILLSFFVSWSYSRKICLNMCQGNSENSYLLRICFIHGTKVSVLQSWIPLQVVDLEQCVECANHTSANQNPLHLKTGFVWKFSWEWLLWMGYPGTLDF